MPDDRCDLLRLDLPVAERLRANRLDAALAARAAASAQALSDPTRLTIAAALAEAHELCVCDLSWICERSQALISHHVRSLRHRGLVRSRRDGKMVMYSLTAEGDRLVGAVLASLASEAARV